MNRCKQVIVGIATDPLVVASARALLLYGLPLGTAWLIGYLNHVTDPRWAGLALLVAAFIRVLEGAIDHALKATQNDAYPLPPADRTPADPPASIPPA